jgi:hypothetical protein
MKKRLILVWATLGLALILAVGPANATITFSEFAVGTLVSNQYAPQGVIFSAGPVNNTLPIIANDGAMPGSPVLSPNPVYAGDFFMTFPSPFTFVQFDSGYWDGIGTGVIQAFDPSNNLIANLSNTLIGVETFTFSGLGPIGKIYFNSSGDGAGGDIDNLNAVPLPGTLLLFGSGILGFIGLGGRRFLKR